MLKEVFLYAAAILVALGVAFASGAGFQNAISAKRDAREANTPRAILGITIDHNWVGACITSQDYKLHCSTDITAQQAFAIGKTLPEGSAMVSQYVKRGGQDDNTI